MTHTINTVVYDVRSCTYKATTVCGETLSLSFNGLDAVRRGEQTCKGCIGEEFMSFEQAISLIPGDILHHKYDKNADGTPQRWKVTGRPKTWKSRPYEFHVPIKRGLREHWYLTGDNLECFEIGTR